MKRLKSCSPGFPDTLKLDKEQDYCLLCVNGEIVSLKVSNGGWKDDMLRPLTARG